MTLSQTAIDYDFEHQTLEEVLAQFRDEYGLNEKNFSMSCYVTGTEELCSFQGDTFRVAASTYKLPLNMYYYDMEAAGQISSTAYIDGYYLPTMHYQTIVNSNNDMAISMLYDLGSFRTYREKMTKYYDQEYPNAYYADNNINSDYMLAVLWTLYCYPDFYAELTENMKIAARGQYLQKYQGEYEIAHKYGYYEGAINDVGIIYTPEPVLVAAYTENVTYGENTLGRLGELLTEYSLYHTNLAEAERLAAEAEARAAEERIRLEQEQKAAEEAAAQAAAEAAAQAEAEAAQAEAEAQASMEAAAAATPSPAPEAEAAPSTGVSVLVAVVTLAAAFLLGLLAGVVLTRIRRK